MPGRTFPEDVASVPTPTTIACQNHNPQLRKNEYVQITIHTRARCDVSGGLLPNAQAFSAYSTKSSCPSSSKDETQEETAMYLFHRTPLSVHRFVPSRVPAAQFTCKMSPSVKSADRGRTTKWSRYDVEKQIDTNHGAYLSRAITRLLYHKLSQPLGVSTKQPNYDTKPLFFFFLVVLQIHAHTCFPSPKLRRFSTPHKIYLVYSSSKKVQRSLSAPRVLSGFSTETSKKNAQ